MSKHRPKPSATSAEPPAVFPSAKARATASVLLVAHFAVILIAQMALQPASPLVARLAGFVEPYVEVAAISRGYAFFAPNPGPSHIVRYELEFADGHVERGQLPDLQEHWPRLLYHRHFMLSEQWNQRHPGAPRPQRPPEADPRSNEFLRWQGAAEAWDGAFADFTGHGRSFAEHLLKRHDAARVRLELWRHTIPSPEMFLDGVALDDERLYELVYRQPWITPRGTAPEPEEVSP